MERTAGIRTQAHRRALASLVFGIAWLAGIGSLLAVVLGSLARRDFARAGGDGHGRGLAIAGTALGVIGVAGAIVFAFWLSTPDPAPVERFQCSSSMSPTPPPC